MTALENYLRLEKATLAFEAEARELLALAIASGDTLERAIEWASDDHVIGQLFDRLEAVRNAA